MEPADLRWLAGLLEGEGTFLRPVPSAPRAPLIRLAMTDHDVVRRAADVLERSVVSPKSERVQGHRTVFMVTVKGAPAIRWMRVLRPYLSRTRQAQIDRALACSQMAQRQTPIPEPVFATEIASGDARCDEDWLAGLLEGEAWFGVASTGDCIVIACGEPHKARGLCHKHYMTWSRDGRAGKAARIRALR